MLEEILVRRHRSPVRGATLGVKRREHATGNHGERFTQTYRGVDDWRRGGVGVHPEHHGRTPNRLRNLRRVRGRSHTVKLRLKVPDGTLLRGIIIDIFRRYVPE